jgi:23S rRNA (uracil1939-C5)-methyltransferase
MSETFHLSPTTYVYGGETLARLPDGRAVFIPFSIPGEQLTVELTEEKTGFARARLLEVLEPSHLRAQPRCDHYGECGGCHYQHLSYPAQVEAKLALLKDQLERIGKLGAFEIHAAIHSNLEYEYRNHVQFHLGKDGSLGFHKSRSKDIIQIRECHLPEPALRALWKQLELEPGSGIERIGFRVGSGDDLQIILESHEPLPPEMSVEDLPVSVVHLSPAGELVLAGSAAVTIEILDRPFRVSAGSFFQVNSGIAARMVSHVLEALDAHGALQPGDTALDLYSGVGLFSAFLAGKVDRLVGIETSPSAVDDFVVNLDEFDGVEIYQGMVEQILPDLDVQPTFVLVDPPRQGLDRRALDALLHLAAPLLVYVSCDPATLGRDAKRLFAGGYRLDEITLFDQFPQTYHIESVSLWTRS